MIETTFTDAIARVTLTRPDKKNALTFEMFDALTQAGRDLADHPGLRAVILSGAGGAFCAGLDLGTMQSMATKMDEVKTSLTQVDHTGANRFQTPVTVWSELQVPVIAAIDGVCLGAGMQLSLGCDFRIVHPDTRMSLMEAKWGLIPDMGVTQFLPKLMRADQAKLLMMSARMFSGAEAHDMGLATQLSQTPLDASFALAQELSARSPEAVAGAKALVDQGWDGGADALALEATLQRDLIGSPNQIESVMANMQKRAPKFA
ncbi:MAG: crotonase/enoyl-CoA hydratase family protein [Pseudomonadota bacterium]